MRKMTAFSIFMTLRQQNVQLTCSIILAYFSIIFLIILDTLEKYNNVKVKKSDYSYYVLYDKNEYNTFLLAEQYFKYLLLSQLKYELLLHAYPKKKILSLCY